ncbi:extracelullar DNA degradation protein EddA [Marmoricola endophyticus]|uniref:Extracelullar DNA degradation protein EddA n=1 Tax=Marmoricola endophyticus TaxID=2040280 RepID=A0A917BQZ1_9ACTN|nr:alkaline phosphatase D family protein [Marmoricola endophyticus]GGF55479.1 extracelullar DNA degradation protein EddA [Marmoricola endophyticus]
MSTPDPAPVRRRTVLGGAAATGGVLAATGWTPPAVAQVRSRLSLPYGVQSGDVGVDGATLWARSSGEGRLAARLVSGGRRSLLRGPVADASSDLTARIDLSDLPAGRDYIAELWFEAADGTRGESRRVSFRTAPDRGRRGTSFVWSGDTAGQGWGINPDIGGMATYDAMRRTRPDFFVHSGDTIYADSPVAESVTEPDGRIWRNVVAEGVEKVAESLAEYRGRHRYNLLDENVRRFYAEVPVIAQWDDHETHNNWYPGQVLTDPAYTEKRVDVLAARARQAWQEYQPIRTTDVTGRGRDGFAAERIYRKISRGPQLDVFCLDMRSYKSPNTTGLEDARTPIFGEEQIDWLVREVAASTATWKVISNDLPLGLVVPDGSNEESLSNGDPGRPLGREHDLARVLRRFKAAGVRNTVWITADVHYTAAHHYSPERATFTDFDPFWEFVTGPISAGSFGPNTLDATFGPRADFVEPADYANQAPRGEKTFFGHVDIDRHDRFTVSLRNGLGQERYRRTLEPAPPR